MPIQPNDMSAAVTRNLPEKTGRSIEEWVALVNEHGPAVRKDRIGWLKSEHGLGHVTASIIVGTADTPDGYRQPTAEELVASQYRGPKAGLRPIYERLAAMAAALGPDVVVDPRKSYVALRKPVQFGLIQVSTRDRVDLGLRLPAGTVETDRLRPAGSFGSGEITHRVGLTSLDQVDDEVAGWLRAAYERR
jgi:predicted transport protein